MSGVLYHEVDAQARIGDVEIDQELVDAFKIGEVHVPCPEQQQQEDRERRTRPHEQLEDQRQSDQQLSILDKKRQQRSDLRRVQRRVQGMKRLCLYQKLGDEFAVAEMMDGPPEKRPSNDDAEEDDEKLLRRGIRLALVTARFPLRAFRYRRVLRCSRNAAVPFASLTEHRIALRQGRPRPKIRSESERRALRLLDFRAQREQQLAAG